MIQHFYGKNINSLCCQQKDIKTRLSLLTEEDIKDLKKLPSIAKYLQMRKESNKNEEELNDKKFKVKLTRNSLFVF